VTISQNNPESARKQAAFLCSDETLQHFEKYIPLITPNGRPEWKEWEFVINPAQGTFDALVVFQSVDPLERTYRLIVPPPKSLLAVLEPPEVLTLADGFTRQFHSVLSQSPHIKCTNHLYTHSAHHWFLERPFDKVLDGSEIDKQKLLSMVISYQQDTEGHRKRWQLATRLKEHFGDQIDWYGRGVQELELKRDGILPYRYHIVLENSAVPHYWTEKIADAFVGNAFPFYWGAPNIADYFPAESFIPIDIDDPDRCIAQIESAIDQNVAETRQSALREARRLLLEDYHPYEMYRRIWNSTPSSPARPVTIAAHSEFPFSLTQKLRFFCKRMLSR